MTAEAWAYPWSPATERDDADALVTSAVKEAIAHAMPLGRLSLTFGDASPELIAWADKRAARRDQFPDGVVDRCAVWSVTINGVWLCIQSRPGERGWIEPEARAA